MEAYMALKSYRALVNTLDAKGSLVTPGKTFKLDEDEAKALPAGTVEEVEDAKPYKKTDGGNASGTKEPVTKDPVTKDPAV
jgi:hypothetical protein